MSSNFYNNSGAMIGFDPHKYHALPPPPTGAVAIAGHLCGASFSDEPSKFYKRVSTVTANKHVMLQGGFDNGLVTHIPIPIPPLPPHPGEALIYTGIMLGSGTKAQLTVHSVTGKGDALACCIISSISLNVNCADPMDFPIGFVINLNTVETQPTLGDYIGAIVGWYIDAVIGFIVGELLGEAGTLGKVFFQAAVKLVVRVAPDFLKQIPVIGPIFDPAGTVSQKVQQTVDDIVQKIRS